MSNKDLKDDDRRKGDPKRIIILARPRCSAGIFI